MGLPELAPRLPVDSLSASSVGLFLKCPERWRRRYLENEYEPISPAGVVGKAVGAAEGDSYQQKIETFEDLAEADVLDSYADHFQLGLEQTPIDWGTEKPGPTKDKGAEALKVYHRRIAPTVQPISVERKFQLHFPDVEWGFRGFIDVEENQDVVSDLKVRGSRMRPQDADTDLQATAYLLAKRSEAPERQPYHRFRFHTMVKTKQPYAEVIPTKRTPTELDSFVERLYRVAAEIYWRTENDVWGYALPGSWWCSSRYCGFYYTCPGGGLR